MILWLSIVTLLTQTTVLSKECYRLINDSTACLSFCCDYCNISIDNQHCFNHDTLNPVTFKRNNCSYGCEQSSSSSFEPVFSKDVFITLCVVVIIVCIVFLTVYFQPNCPDPHWLFSFCHRTSTANSRSKYEPIEDKELGAM